MLLQPATDSRSRDRAAIPSAIACRVVASCPRFVDALRAAPLPVRRRIHPPPESQLPGVPWQAPLEEPERRDRCRQNSVPRRRHHWLPVASTRRHLLRSRRLRYTPPTPDTRSPDSRKTRPRNPRPGGNRRTRASPRPQPSPRATSPSQARHPVPTPPDTPARSASRSAASNWRTAVPSSSMRWGTCPPMHR